MPIPMPFSVRTSPPKMDTAPLATAVAIVVAVRLLRYTVPLMVTGSLVGSSSRLLTVVRVAVTVPASLYIQSQARWNIHISLMQTILPGAASNKSGYSYTV